MGDGVDHVDRDTVEDGEGHRHVADEHTEGDGHQEQGLVVLGDAQVQEDEGHQDHHSVEPGKVHEAAVAQDLVLVARDVAPVDVLGEEPGVELGDIAQAFGCSHRDHGVDARQLAAIVVEVALGGALQLGFGDVLVPLVHAEVGTAVLQLELEVAHPEIRDLQVLGLAQGAPWSEGGDPGDGFEIIGMGHHELAHLAAHGIHQAALGGLGSQIVVLQAVSGALAEAQVGGARIEGDLELGPRGGQGQGGPHQEEQRQESLHDGLHQRVVISGRATSTRRSPSPMLSPSRTKTLVTVPL
ncbi:MAG: hypothetical protein BWY56_01995 [Acidobacteria bacterium ADurb.Bin340]|nr:MAG: hypothetical protein BWY56_01995 [Acidobacteria bacterium ADurb.Bin340]